jgi:thymidylate synthase
MNKLDKQYQDLLQSILDYGVEKKDRTGTGTKSIFGYTIRHNMQDGFPLLTTKKMAWKTMVTELLWFLRGDTNIKFLVDNGCHIWDGDAFKNFMNTSEGDPDLVWSQEQFIEMIKTDDEFAKQWGELGPVYGKQWRRWGIEWEDTESITYIDQIANLINDLKTNPDSRRLMVNAWNVGELDQMVLPPCHYGFQVYTRELSFEERYVILKSRTNEDPLKYSRLDNGDYDQHPKEMTTKWMNEENIPTRAISLMWNQRSVDTFLGLPFNIASYGLLLTILAKEVNMVPDQLIGNLGDTHLYLNHIEQAKEQIGREPFELPTLKHMKTDEFYKSLSEDASLFTHLNPTDFQLENYQSHPTIKAPLSN